MAIYMNSWSSTENLDKYMYVVMAFGMELSFPIYWLLVALM